MSDKIQSLERYLVHPMPNITMSSVHKNCGLHLFRSSSGYSYTRERGIDYSDLRYFQFYAISHMFAGEGFYINATGQKLPVKAGDCIMVSPNTLHLYGAENKSFFSEDSINFYGPLADMLYKSGLLYDGVASLGLTRELIPIINLANDPSNRAQLNVALALQKLLYGIYNQNFSKQTSSDEARIDALVSVLKESPEKWWDIEDLANFCNLPVHKFRKLFLKRVGVMPKIYMDKLRMTNAATMLYEKKIPIKEVALRCGYSDPFHFSRRFKAIMGESPQKYRIYTDLH